MQVNPLKTTTDIFHIARWVKYTRVNAGVVFSSQQVGAGADKCPDYFRVECENTNCSREEGHTHTHTHLNIYSI